MTTPGQLYQSYTENPCFDTVGDGSPYNLVEFTQFLKQVKYPCLKDVPGYTELLNDTNYHGSGKLALPYKFLEIFDPHLFSEIQPRKKDGPAHSIRNAADVSRACDLVEQEKSLSSNDLTGILYHTIITKKALGEWGGRGATEHMTFFGSNSITKCLFVLGPDLANIDISLRRGTGCDDMSCLPPFKRGGSISALGAGFSCQEIEGKKECDPCEQCPPEDDLHPCCQGLSCADRANLCCGDPSGDGITFIYTPPQGNNVFLKQRSDRIPDGINLENFNIFHLGYLSRKKYGGYVNLQDCTDNLFSCPADLLIKYVQENNGYNYSTNKNIRTTNKIQRVKTITYVDNIQDIKRLIYNGYGITLLSNIGFSKEKDSYGLSFPDKIWYHSYAVVGYDDTKKHFDECVYVLANSWGDWNSGGNPPWGKLPKGCFLVTETHLKGMINLERIDKIGCRDKREIFLAADGERFIDIPGCVEDNDCVPWECDKKQRPMGMAFLICFSDSIKKRHFDYQKMINISQTDYSYSSERNIFTTGVVNGDNNIFYNNLSGVLRKEAFSTPPFENTEFPTNVEEFIESLEINNQTNLTNLNLDFIENSGLSDIKYLKNETKHFGSLFDKKTLMSSEANSVVSIGEKLSEGIEELYLDNLYGKELNISEVKLFFNNIKANNVIISGVTEFGKLSKEIKQSLISANSVSVIDSTLLPNIKIFAQTYVVFIGCDISSKIEIISPIIILKNSTNFSNLNGNVFFIDGSENHGNVIGTAIFSKNIPNFIIPNDTQESGDGESVNSGTIFGNGFFEESDHTEIGIITGDCIKDENSNIDGQVMGRIIEQKKIFQTVPRRVTPR